MKFTHHMTVRRRGEAFTALEWYKHGDAPEVKRDNKGVLDALRALQTCGEEALDMCPFCSGTTGRHGVVPHHKSGEFILVCPGDLLIYKETPGGLYLVGEHNNKQEKELYAVCRRGSFYLFFEEA